MSDVAWQVKYVREMCGYYIFDWCKCNVYVISVRLVSNCSKVFFLFFFIFFSNSSGDVIVRTKGQVTVVDVNEITESLSQEVAALRSELALIRSERELELRSVSVRGEFLFGFLAGFYGYCLFYVYLLIYCVHSIGIFFL